MMKGISPLLAGIMLVAITAVSATIISGWVSSTFSESQRSVDNTSSGVIRCSTADITIDNVYIRDGSGGSASIAVRNSGYVDGMRVTSAQIFDRLGNNFTANNSMTLNKGDIGGLEFNFPSVADTVNDSSSNGNGGVCTNMPGNRCGFTLSGKSGSAMEFDGIDDYINISDSSSLNITASAITIELWVKPGGTDARSFYSVLRKGNFSGDPLTSYNYVLFIRGSSSHNALYAQFKGTVGNFSAGTSNEVVSNHVWQHIATRYNGSTVSFYRDGILVSSSDAVLGNLVAFPSLLFIGRSQTQSEYFNGTIDEVKIWNRALSDTEINQSMNGLEMNQAGLAMWQRFNGGKGILSCPADFGEARVTTQCADAVDTYKEAPSC
ncbi:MAG: LamG domain-containing protein [Candidatus Aenigmarchaeota archaeon]|nr:LamG domain-containing protein [Candidatus Aenigmarchaeota archaeon]